MEKTEQKRSKGTLVWTWPHLYLEEHLLEHWQHHLENNLVHGGCLAAAVLFATTFLPLGQCPLSGLFGVLVCILGPYRCRLRAAGCSAVWYLASVASPSLWSILCTHHCFCCPTVTNHVQIYQWLCQPFSIRKSLGVALGNKWLIDWMF